MAKVSKDWWFWKNVHLANELQRKFINHVMVRVQEYCSWTDVHVQGRHTDHLNEGLNEKRRQDFKVWTIKLKQTFFIQVNMNIILNILLFLSLNEVNSAVISERWYHSVIVAKERGMWQLYVKTKNKNNNEHKY